MLCFALLYEFVQIFVRIIFSQNELFGYSFVSKISYSSHYAHLTQTMSGDESDRDPVDLYDLGYGYGYDRGYSK